jgi:hypothetical protein
MIVALLAIAPQMAALAQARQSAAAMPDWWPGTPERLATRAQIEALSLEYYYRLDHGEADRVPELFTQDGTLQMSDDAPIVGRKAIEAFYAARSKTRRTRHVSTNLRLTYVDANHVEAVREITYYAGETANNRGPYPAEPAIAEYAEKLVRGEDGRWRYAWRKATPVFGARP